MHVSVQKLLHSGLKLYQKCSMIFFFLTYSLSFMCPNRFSIICYLPFSIPNRHVIFMFYYFIHQEINIHFTKVVFGPKTHKQYKFCIFITKNNDFQRYFLRTLLIWTKFMIGMLTYIADTCATNANDQKRQKISENKENRRKKLIYLKGRFVHAPSLTSVHIGNTDKTLQN